MGWGEPWANYAALGLRPEHIPDLIRMATDSSLFKVEREDEGDDPASWAPIHGWRALGQLRAEAAIGPLLDLLAEAEAEADDTALEDLPQVLGMIGPAAMPALVAFLADRARGIWTRVAVSNALTSLAQHHPELRDQCIALIVGQLEADPADDPAFHGFLVSDLLGLKAVEAAPAIERAFEADQVDESIAGDWPWVRYKLGLGEKPPPRRYNHGFNFGLSTPSRGLPVSHADPAQAAARKEKNKARRKLAKKSRKQNRKRR